MGQLGAWWHMLTSIGPGLRGGRQADTMFRFYVHQSLADLGFFDCLREPRTYGEILARFGFIDGEYTREVMDTLVKDPRHTLLLNDGHYSLHPQARFPSLDETLAKVDPRIRPTISLVEGLKDTVLDRLREERIGIAELFERGEYPLVDRFNAFVGGSFYSRMRLAVLAIVSPEEKAWLKGKRLLNIGCGSGRETAELWLQFGGDIHITAIDAVPGMIEHAEENFETLVDETCPQHPPVTPENRPIFKLASATQLPFGDNSFDATFWLLVLHWTSDPRKAISEAARVVRPGGLHLSCNAFKPEANPYTDLVIRGHRNSFGFFWREDFRRWFREQGVEADPVTPAGLTCARNRKDLLPVPAQGRAPS
ncbi:MAG: methyltransferase domain-containing protein [Anaerolineales bacterium]|nr:methyltransferase domain-containing protein [Anaerolineales bacterium]